VTTPPRGGGGETDARHNLVVRITSAAVLAPLVLAIAYVGGWAFLVLCALAAAGILWEWMHLVAGRSDPRLLVPGWAALLAALVLTGMGHPAAAGAVVVLGAVADGLVALAATEGQASRVTWAAGGVVYAGVAFLGPALLRSDRQLGFEAFVFVALTVWMTDILAFLVGRLLGGPLLWPRVTPNKTWSGAIGGLAGGVAGGIAVAYASGSGRLASLGVLALALSLLAQAGDLFESAVKRRFGVKDAGRIIPGHGGLMDRLDGFLFAAAAAAIIGILRDGTAAAAHGLLLW
jgi:phosphatidate cytidylyltransferase